MNNETADDPYTTNDFSKRLFPHYVHDKERIIIDRKRFRMLRHSDSNEDTEVIEIQAIEPHIPYEIPK